MAKRTGIEPVFSCVTGKCLIHSTNVPYGEPTGNRTRTKMLRASCDYRYTNGP